MREGERKRGSRGRMKREFDERETRKSGNVEAVLPIEVYMYRHPFQEKYTGTRNEAIGHYPLDI